MSDLLNKSSLEELKNTNPQQMLEDAFRAIYQRDIQDEKSRVEEKDKLYAYQIEWCNKFEETFSFVSQYGGRICKHIEDDFSVKMFHVEKCIITVVSESGGYSIEIHPPEPGSDKCLCREDFLYETLRGGVYRLTLPEITVHISKGLANANADNKTLD